MVLNRVHLVSKTKKIITKTTSLTSAMALLISSAGLSLAVFGGAASAIAPTTIYNNIPGNFPTNPSNVSSEGPEAYAYKEIGGQVQFAGTDRFSPTVTVGMSSWACQSGNWYSGNCSTTTSTKYSMPITLNVYQVNADNSVGSLIKTDTETFSMPYRPSAATVAQCDDTTAWYDSVNHVCNHGLGFDISFNLTGTTLPNKAIISVAYNSTHYGYTPYGQSTACYSTTAGCFYDSLNVGLSAPPTVGTDPLPSDIYQNAIGSEYCDSGAGGNNTFRRDAGCWAGYQPVFMVTATPVLVTPPTHLSQCDNNGWKVFNNPSFFNAGQCVGYVWSHSHTIASYADYTAYGLKRHASMLMFTATNQGTFDYSDANHDWYHVNVSDVSVSGNNGYFAGKVTTASNHSWIGNWIFAEVRDGSPDQIWGSFTSQTAAENGVTAMSNPADGPFNITSGNISVN